MIIKIKLIARRQKGNRPGNHADVRLVRKLPQVAYFARLTLKLSFISDTRVITGCPGIVKIVASGHAPAGNEHSNPIFHRWLRYGITCK